MGALGMIGGPGEIEKALPSYTAFMNDYGTAFRSFRHGALHGAFTGILFVFPILAINNLYAHKPFKLTLITAGYWVITLGIMGGIICGWNSNGFCF